MTLNGEPLDDGSIQFSSVGMEKPFAGGAVIRNGEYSIPQAKGLAPGAYHVEISAPDTKAPQVMSRATPGGPGILTAPERVPPEYNAKSTQSVEVKVDGDNHFVFDIVSKSKR